MATLRFRVLAALALGAALLLPLAGVRPAPVMAQQDLGQQVLERVNSLRLTRGLAPYAFDAGLMASAQDHSEYQASIKEMTHTHRGGGSALDQGLRENIATGTVGWITAEFIVNIVWADDIHMQPMVGYPSGTMGVGVASDGQDYYVTLHVRAGGSGGNPPAANPPAAKPAAPTATQAPANSPGADQPAAAPTLPPADPPPSGFEEHIIASGETLWALALQYGTTVEQLRSWNGIPEYSNDIYVGQALRVPAMIVPTATAESAATAEPAATATSAPAEPAAQAPTATATQAPTLAPSATQPPALTATAVLAAKQAATVDPAYMTDEPPLPTPTTAPAGQPGPLAAVLAGVGVLAALAALGYYMILKKRG